AVCLAALAPLIHLAALYRLVLSVSTVCYLHPMFPFFFFNDPAPPEIYTLSLHDALPISHRIGVGQHPTGLAWDRTRQRLYVANGDRKSTRLNSSHVKISYAVFCLKKKKKTTRKRTAATKMLSSVSRCIQRPPPPCSFHCL